MAREKEDDQRALIGYQSVTFLFSACILFPFFRFPFIVSRFMIPVSCSSIPLYQGACTV
jgi:hypothetical protein